MEGKTSGRKAAVKTVEEMTPAEREAVYDSPEAQSFRASLRPLSGLPSNFLPASYASAIGLGVDGVTA